MRASLGRWHPLAVILLFVRCAITYDADGQSAVRQWVDGADERALALLHVRVDPLSGRRRPPSDSPSVECAGRGPGGDPGVAGGSVVATLQVAGLARRCGAASSAAPAKTALGRQHGERGFLSGQPEATSPASGSASYSL